MKITKTHLCDLPSCYAASQTIIDSRPHLLLAPDAPGPCFMFDTKDFSQTTVWTEPGGTMSMIPLPGKDGDFLAVQRFNPGFQALDAEIVHLHRCADGTWQAKPLFKLPYVHRFDILERDGQHYLICCTVCSAKEYEQDWRSPGKILVAELPDDLSKPIELQVIADDMTRNHGYLRVANDGFTSAITSCDQGIFQVLPPEKPGQTWQIQRIFDRAVSDMAFCDLDGDGVLEMATIEPFHGEDFIIYKKTAAGYEPIYRYPNPMSFIHVVWGGYLRGEPVFIGGCRGNEQELFLLRWKEGQIAIEYIEKGHGPSNIEVIHEAERDLLLVANHERGEGAVFTIED